MNDKQIRNVLISYLKAQHSELRIYQEKSIGGSTCDLMLVTECLTGYEIKSDLDNYQRLSSQVVAYDRFFNYNYVVVGKRHARSISDKVPSRWGILVVEEDSVVLERQASRNTNLSISAQLSILWKLELKNL